MIGSRTELSLPEIVGRGYGTFWRSRCRYRVVKGSRASKKSKTTALWFIVNMMNHPQANALVIRKTFRTLKDSCFTELCWAIRRLGVEAWWEIKESPLEMTYKPTGQRIYFRGLDDPLKITSITVEAGVLCWAWLEEAYEITREADFDTLDESIRGEVPRGLFKQWTITFNPWNERHWLKRRFFDTPSPDVLAMTTNYLCNEWLDAADLALFARMRERDPQRYRVAGLGDWGVTEGLVYENWREETFSLDAVRHLPAFFGLDFGYTNDPTAFAVLFLDKDADRIYVWDEFYERGMSNLAIWQRIVSMGYGKERITGDGAEPKSIDELRGYGLRIRGSRKGKDSVANGIQWVRRHELIVHPRCVSFLTELSCYVWATDRGGTRTNVPIDDQNHLMDAMRYALEDCIREKRWLI